ncbi:hypothetical protein 2 [Beihai shrimp virus 5]|uniref:hypothetical protein 2 n=1 Tax=Beihai shrimp virus 5 TaxID=1922671 RepID=UPI00090C9846|nr:hypothetical protein 2 [Beihai shrimp virus 5]APG75678.1 hypothetical protein 2 [Beihai shrimp virus 5]
MGRELETRSDGSGTTNGPNKFRACLDTTHQGSVFSTFGNSKIGVSNLGHAVSPAKEESGVLDSRGSGNVDPWSATQRTTGSICVFDGNYGGCETSTSGTYREQQRIVYESGTIGKRKIERFESCERRAGTSQDNELKNSENVGETCDGRQIPTRWFGKSETDEPTSSGQIGNASSCEESSESFGTRTTERRNDGCQSTGCASIAQETTTQQETEFVSDCSSERRSSIGSPCGFAPAGDGEPIFARRDQPTMGRFAWLHEQAVSAGCEPIADKSTSSAFEWPPYGGDSEYQSLCAHAKLRADAHSNARTPTKLERSAAIAATYRANSKFSKWSLPVDFLSRAHLVRVIRALDFTSSPGLPICKYSPTISDFLRVDPVTGLPDREREDRLIEEVYRWLDEGDIQYYIRLFIKYEPHKLSKISAKRFRLIWSIPLVHQIVDHLLFDAQNDREVQTSSLSEFKGGSSFAKGGCLDYFSHTPGWHLSADKSLWDFTVPAWACEDDLEFRSMCCLDSALNPEKFKIWLECAQRRYNEMFNLDYDVKSKPTLIQLSDGRRFLQLTKGLMKSGSVITLSANSHMQSFFHRIAWSRVSDVPAPLIWSMGDDTTLRVSRDFPTELYLRETSELGAIVKFANLTVNEYEFAGMIIKQPMCLIPSKNDTHYYKLLFETDERLLEMLHSYQFLYAADNRLKTIQYVLSLLPGGSERIETPMYLNQWLTEPGSS